MPSPSDAVTANYATLLQVAATLKTQAGRFENQFQQTQAAREDLLGGAEQFAAQLDTGAAAFAASWQATFEVCTNSATLCAHVTQRNVVDLTETDAQMAGELRL